MRIVITGGNGYIGGRLSLYLANKGFEIIPICFPAIPDNKEWKDNMTAIYEADLRKDETISLIASLKPDIIIHLVSLDHHESAKEPKFVNDINVLPIWRLLDACSKKDLKKFIYFSTFQVYGRVENTLINEAYKTCPVNIYGLTHLLSEQICNYYNTVTDVDCITIRLSNSYGSPVFNDNNCWWLVINELCMNAYTNGKIQLKSDGSPLRDFIHSSDLCQAIKHLIDREKKTFSNIYNLSSGKTLSILELAFKVREVFFARYNKLINIILPENKMPDYPNSVTGREQFTIDNTKLRELGFAPKFDLKEGINELFNYLEQNNAK